MHADAHEPPTALRVQRTCGDGEAVVDAVNEEDAVTEVVRDEEAVNVRVDVTDAVDVNDDVDVADHTMALQSYGHDGIAGVPGTLWQGHTRPAGYVPAHVAPCATCTTLGVFRAKVPLHGGGINDKCTSPPQTRRIWRLTTR